MFDDLRLLVELLLRVTNTNPGLCGGGQFFVCDKMLV